MLTGETPTSVFQQKKREKKEKLWLLLKDIRRYNRDTASYRRRRRRRQKTAEFSDIANVNLTQCKQQYFAWGQSQVAAVSSANRKVISDDDKNHFDTISKQKTEKKSRPARDECE